MDSDTETDRKMDVMGIHGTETITMQDQPPPYTSYETSSTTHIGSGFNIGTGTGMAMGPGVGSNYVVNHMGPPMIQSHHNGLVTTVASGMVITQFTSKQASVICQSCRAQVVTNCKRKTSWKTHFIAMSFCLVCFFPCAIAIYCIDDCKNADHYCPECESYLGSYVI